MLPQTARKIEIGILVITALPILCISFFNHPLGDDYWFSAMVRQQGFMRAFSSIYDTVSARYTALCLMGINPLVFGNFALFKLLPLLYIFLLATATFLLIITTIPTRNRNRTIRNDVLLVSAIFTITYLAVMPGIGEGLFWTSSLVVYQCSILGFMVWLASMVAWYRRQQRNVTNLIATILTFVLTIGCNEIMGAIVCGVNISIGLYLLIKQRKIDALSTTLFLLMIPCWYFIISAPSFATRYGNPASPDISLWLSSAIQAIKYAGYHILKCFINPFFWIGVILAVKPLINIRKAVEFDTVLSWRKLIIYGAVLLAVMTVIEWIAIALTADHIPPLRITNLAVYFLFFGLLALGLNTIHFAPVKEGSSKFRIFTMLILLVPGFFLPNNVSMAARAITSKEAYFYNQEMNRRYILIATCKTDTCSIPLLKHRPQVLRFSSFDNDRHIGEYFGKSILYGE